MAKKSAGKTKPRKSSGRMASKGFPNPIDVHVGQRMRQRRTLLGMTQETLAAAIGLTFQQVQKYEKGSNRVSSSRLFDLSRILDVPIAFFFEDIPGDVQNKSPSKLMGVKVPELVEYEPDPTMKRETLELVRAYYRIPHRATRKRLAEMVKVLAKAGGEE
ncbi:MAG: helix-turn-helix domain-containing protein [Rhodospirillaceae bacterium]|nr:helix-turn-helix domain-containing protein [Rhodospirillaceae bacterium]